MPTEEDYTHAAARFRAFGARIDAARVPRPSGRWAAFGEGPAAATVDRLITAIAADVVVAADECRRMAAVCDRRAEICGRYRREMSRYWILVVIDPSARRPVRPAPWAEL